MATGMRKAKCGEWHFRVVTFECSEIATGSGEQNRSRLGVNRVTIWAKLVNQLRRPVNQAVCSICHPYGHA